jgi:hypothetical protein
MRIAIAICSALFFSSEGNAAEDSVITGNDMMAACAVQDEFRPGQNPNMPSRSEALTQGVCLGMINGVRFFARAATRGTDLAVCIPKGVSVGQVNSVVVRYLRAHPERQHEDFFLLAVNATAAAWPCKP